MNIEKIGGVGLVNLIVITIFVMVMVVGLKAILTNHHVDGLSEFVQAV